MSAPERIKPKTIRLAILLALADGAITTIDDLQIKIDEPRKKVAGAVYPAATEGLIKRLRDDVTGAPAYQITATGREYLAKYAGTADVPEAPDDSARQQSEAVALGALEAAMPGFAAEVVAQKDAEIGQLRETLARIELMVRNSSAKAVGNDAPVEDLLADILHRSAQQHAPVGYVMQRPTKPLVRFMKAEKAQARALAFARAGHRAQVFALVPVGAAVPGAEWVAA